jgi:toxin ParE1/3/4
VEHALDYYLREAGPRLALEFLDSLQASYRSIADHPAAGSPRYAHELNLPGLRSRTLKRFPYLVFYVERYDHVDVWRVPHAHRDIPAWIPGPEE